jgi:hypothetical protein
MRRMNKLLSLSSNKGLKKSKKSTEDSLEDSFCKEDKKEGVVKPIMEKKVVSLGNSGLKKTRSAIPIKKQIKINLNGSNTPRKENLNKMPVNIFNTPGLNFNEANKFLKKSNSKTEKKIIIQQKMDFKNFIKIKAFDRILQFLNYSEIKALLTSFKKMKILCEDFLLTKNFSIVGGFEILKNHLQLIKKKIKFSRRTGKII